MNEERMTKRPSDSASLNSIQSDSPEKRPKLQPSVLRKTQTGLMERIAETDSEMIISSGNEIKPESGLTEVDDCAAGASGYSKLEASLGASSCSISGTSGYAPAGTAGITLANTSGSTPAGTTGITLANTSGSTPGGTTGITLANTSGSPPAGTNGITLANTSGSTPAGTTEITLANTSGSPPAGTNGITLANTSGSPPAGTTGYTPAGNTGYTLANTSRKTPAGTSGYTPADTTKYRLANIFGNTPADTAGYTPADTTGYTPTGTTGYTLANTCRKTPAGTTRYTPAGTSGYTPAGTTGYTLASTSRKTPADTTGYTPAGTTGYTLANTSRKAAASTSGYTPAGTSRYAPASTFGYVLAKRSVSAVAGPSEYCGTVGISDEESLESEVSSETEAMSQDSTVPFSLSPPQLWQDTSLVQDVDSVVCTVVADLVDKTLAQSRVDPGRFNIATAAVLDSGPDPVKGADQADTSPVLDVSDATVDSGQIASTTSLGENDFPIPGTSQDDSGYYEDVQKVVLKVKAEKPDVEVSPTEVYCLLVQHARMQGFLPSVHRVDYAASFLLKNKTCNRPLETTRTSNINNQAMTLSAEVPHVKCSRTPDLLKAVEDEEDCLKTVQEKLRALPSTSAAHHLIQKPIPKVESPNNALNLNDPSNCDMKTIANRLPDKKRKNEIYAVVEVNQDRPGKVHKTIENLQTKGTTAINLNVVMTSNIASKPSTVSDPEPGTSTMLSPPPPHYFVTAAAASNFGDLQEDVQHLTAIFPDCDPNYIYERLYQSTGNANRVNIIATDMLERENYPRLKDALKSRLHKRQLRMEEFLAKFPNPVASFGNTEAKMTANYLAHLDVQLKHDFPQFKLAVVKEVLARHNSHLFPSVRELERTRDQIMSQGGESPKLRIRQKRTALKYPIDPDELFFYELWYLENEQRVKDYFQQKKEARTAKVEEARQQKALYECTCCFDEELLFEEMTACSDGHLFCQQCIVQSVESAFAKGKTTFPCLTGYCEHPIPLSVLRQLLPSTFLSKVLHKLQEEEVQQAGLPNLVKCPFCRFATIIDDPENTVFRCLNPDCLKDSCKLCRKLNHAPLKCGEVVRKETNIPALVLNGARIPKLPHIHQPPQAGEPIVNGGVPTNVTNFHKPEEYDEESFIPFLIAIFLVPLLLFIFK